MRRVAIVSVGMSDFRSSRDDATYPELVWEAASLCLEGCDVSLRDIQAVVFSLAPDALVGVSNAERWCVDAVGAVGKPFMRVNTGGSTGMSAVQTAFYHVASGHFDVALAVGADKVGESGDAQQVLNRMWDIPLERPMPLNAINMLAFQAVRYMDKYGSTEEHMALVSVKNRKNALGNARAHLRKAVTVQEVLDSRVICWPIKLLDACPQSSGGCAVLLCSEEVAERVTRTPAWIKGLAHVSDTYWLGDRMGPSAEHDHADADVQAEACWRAYRMAGITNPREELDVAELYAPFTNIELQSIEAAGLCGKGEAWRLMEKGAFDMNGTLPVNPSGGVLCANPIAVTAMVRVAEAALQVMGKAEGHQVDGVRRAVVTGVGGDHQFIGAMVLDKQK